MVCGKQNVCKEMQQFHGVGRRMKNIRTDIKGFFFATFSAAVLTDWPIPCWQLEARGEHAGKSAPHTKAKVE